MTKIKICGITRPQNAHDAIELGVDALGFVFFAKSKRDITQADLKWIKQLPPFVQLVGLFVNPEKQFVTEVIEKLPIELIQFHGKESAEFCEQFNRRYIKAVPMQNASSEQAEAFMQQHPVASSFLLDNYGTTEIGGSGTAFDWQQIPDNSPAPLTLAGGLDADNVGEVVSQANPYAVDVSSGVELSPGIKSAEKMAAFIKSVRLAAN